MQFKGACRIAPIILNTIIKLRDYGKKQLPEET